MEDRTIPPSSTRSPQRPVNLSRVCESSRLQRQLLAHAYQQVCPQIRARLDSGARQFNVEPDYPSAARVAAGA